MCVKQLVELRNMAALRALCQFETLGNASNQAPHDRRPPTNGGCSTHHDVGSDAAHAATGGEFGTQAEIGDEEVAGSAAEATSSSSSLASEDVAMNVGLSDSPDPVRATAVATSSPISDSTNIGRFTAMGDRARLQRDATCSGVCRSVRARLERTALHDGSQQIVVESLNDDQDGDLGGRPAVASVRRTASAPAAIAPNPGTTASTATQGSATTSPPRSTTAPPIGSASNGFGISVARPRFAAHVKGLVDNGMDQDCRRSRRVDRYGCRHLVPGGPPPAGRRRQALSAAPRLPRRCAL